MKLIITGSSGFVGQNLISYLSGKFKLHYLNRENLNANVLLLINIDDVIIHLAGKAHDLKKTSNPDEYYKVNFELTKNLYDSFLKSDAKKFIFISSVKAATDFADKILSENVTPNPQTHYGKSKLMAEEYIQSQFLPPEKSYYILRPCMIHGPGNKGNLNLLYKFVKKGIPYPLAAFNNERSFLSIQNFCFIIKEIIESNSILSGIYNISDDEALSTNEVVSVLGESLNVKPKLWKIPQAIIKLTAKVGDFLHLPLTTERLNKLTECYIVDNRKLKAALNVELPLKAIEGLKITANSFNKH
jgi:nucleoside-diphosphate-sugar epimerase